MTAVRMPSCSTEAATVSVSTSWSSSRRRFLTPIEELFNSARIGGARIAVTNAGGEEFDEAATRAFTARLRMMAGGGVSVSLS
jgi:hypothetical protein